jgi:opacity protein-like surface antigen
MFHLTEEFTMKKIALLGAVLALVSPPALAEGMYVGAKLGQASYDFSNITNNNQAAFGFLAGFVITNSAFVEVEYDNLGGYDSPTGNVSGRAFSLSGVGSVQLNSQFSLFGKLGIASTILNDKAKPGFVGDVSYSNTGLNFGLGAHYNISPYVGVRAGLDSFKVGNANSNADRMRMVYMGATFRL